MAPPPRPLRDPGELFWAWLAGFFDGDGVIGVYEISGYPQARVRVGQVQPEPLHFIAKHLGSGAVVRGGGTSVGNQVWQLSYAAAQARFLVERMRPFLRHPAKISGAEAVLAWRPIEVPRHAIELKPDVKKALRLYSGGMSASAVATRLGKKGATVNYWLRKLKVTRSLSDAAKLRRRD